ncbi:cuticle protein 16.8 [Trichonephila inaurata madagascariensis]|uniref:Cuticle protein 16.8 n=1 Tax=Trichonephila inaurata madagascariensis TaxID=2747483 RepID=A0A8X6Y4R5_9ARAC|nr:cuticle protein 16.8 [Trichonephila inaurata madagascariensis]
MHCSVFIKLCKAFVFATLAVTAFASLHVPVHHAPQPYKFGYSIKDHHGEQHREESGNGGHAVRGSYGFTDARGIRREVHYVADHGGLWLRSRPTNPEQPTRTQAAVHSILKPPRTWRICWSSRIGICWSRRPIGYAGLEELD